MRPSESVARMVSVTPLSARAFFVISAVRRNASISSGERVTGRDRRLLPALQGWRYAEKDEGNDERAAGAMHGSPLVG